MMTAADMLAKLCQILEDAKPPCIRDQVLIDIDEVEGLRHWFQQWRRTERDRLVKIVATLSPARRPASWKAAATRSAWRSISE